jgi:hypothetical protein
MNSEDRPKILGVNTRYYPTQASIVNHPRFLPMVDQSEDPPPTLCVLVAGEIGDYAAYVGHGEPEWVARHGDKISFDEACCHFPGGQLVREKYRER